MNLPNWTGGCTRHEVRVAIEVKHLMWALGGPHEYLGAPKPPPLPRKGGTDGTDERTFARPDIQLERFIWEKLLVGSTQKNR